MIVITGSTGNVGAEAAHRLGLKGYRLRLLVRDAVKAPDLANTELVLGSYSDSDSLAKLMYPGDHVFMVSVFGDHESRMVNHRTFIQAAAKARVGHLVYLSFLNAAPDAVFMHAHTHWETEKLIRETGLPFTFLRTSIYNATFPIFFINGLLRAPAGNGLWSWVERKDCGAAVAAVLRRPAPHAGKTYNLTGPEALTMEATIGRLRQLLGVEYRFEDVDDLEHIRAQLRLVSGSGHPQDSANIEWELPFRRSCFRAAAAGEFALVTDDIKKLTGSEAASMDRFIRENADRFPVPAKASGA